MKIICLKLANERGRTLENPPSRVIKLDFSSYCILCISAAVLESQPFYFRVPPTQLRRFENFHAPLDQIKIIFLLIKNEYVILYAWV